MSKNRSIIGLLTFGIPRSNHVASAQVILEAIADQERIAFQKTGESGKVTFAHLDKGIYKLVIELPQQAGKMEVKETLPDAVQVGYHSGKKLLLFQNSSGYFSIRFTKISNLLNNNLTPMYEPDLNFRNNRILIGKLEVIHKFGSIALEISAHTQRKFIKLAKKYKEDAEMSVIHKSL
ncbi:MAG TPA: hypothetical protein VFD91_11330 [Mariniphaga sp.]|nr:hypothetical protein [Mariniphaga sp.]